MYQHVSCPEVVGRVQLVALWTPAHRENTRLKMLGHSILVMNIDEVGTWQSVNSLFLSEEQIQQRNGKGL